MSNGRLPCSSCNVQPGTTSCEGCAKKFCHRCLNDHRDALINKLEVLANNRNELKEEFDRSVTNNSAAAQQIDQWARDMHQKIDQVAQKAKEQVQRAMSRTSDGIRKKLSQVTEEIQQRQKIGEVLGTEVDSIRKDLQKLERNIQQMSQEIRIDTSNSQSISWSSLISVIGPTSNGYEPNPPKYGGGRHEPDRSVPPYYDNGQRNQSNGKCSRLKIAAVLFSSPFASIFSARRCTTSSRHAAMGAARCSTTFCSAKSQSSIVK